MNLIRVGDPDFFFTSFQLWVPPGSRCYKIILPALTPAPAPSKKAQLLASGSWLPFLMFYRPWLWLCLKKAQLLGTIFIFNSYKYSQQKYYCYHQNEKLFLLPFLKMVLDFSLLLPIQLSLFQLPKLSLLISLLKFSYEF
jgi:hypothetical protein